MSGVIEQLEIFPGDNNFFTGFDEIDAQHKSLVRLLNILTEDRVYHTDAPRPEAIFTELMDYALIYFASEERVWGEHFQGDSWKLSHKKLHSGFFIKMLQFKNGDTGKPLDELLEEVVASSPAGWPCTSLKSISDATMSCSEKNTMAEAGAAFSRGIDMRCECEWIFMDRADKMRETDRRR